MQTENWKKVKDLLNEVLPLNSEERRKYFDDAKISDEIRTEVESLLDFEEESENLMQLSMVEYLKDFIASDELGEHNLVGQNIGVYKIVRELGYGGMGAVYQAERTDGKFEQQVALKLLKREMNTAALRRRFGQEREILASLEHPNIARLLDAGTTDDKIPYFAMEFVEGLPINDYCDKHNLDLTQRLELFIKVCSAVDFAHRNLIVHRDLKPSNILITDDGTPKLLDFGISKILSAEFENINTATITKLGVMTPSYASPEQLQSKSVTTTTDIYSLGVILYELLSGHRPFETKEENLKEIYQAVIETDPPLPSSLVETGFKQLKAISEAETEIFSKKQTPATEINKPRHTNPQTVNLSSQSLRGDLDNIVLKALRKEPERRYLSAENFSEDIKRHLRGLPVTARPNTFSYRAEKFISRNKASVIAAILITLAIIGGIIATLWQAKVAQTERAKAERRFNDVRSLANSFLFELSPKIEKLPGSTEARKELVNLALEYLDSLSQESSDDLELQRELAAAYEKVGDVQGKPSNPNIGDIKGAIQSYEKALSIRQQLLDNEPDNISYQNDLAEDYKVLGEIHTNGGDYDKGEIFLDKALEIRRKILAQNPQDYELRATLAETINSRGHISFFDQENKKAIEYYDQSKEIYEKLLEEKPDDYQIERKYASNYVDLGEAYGWDNNLQKGEENLDKSLSILLKLREKYPNDQTIQRSLIISYLKTADNYADFEKVKKGLELFKKGVVVAQNLSNADPQSVQAKRDLGIITRKLAEVLDRTGKSRESLDKMLEALEIFKELRDKDPNNSRAIYDVANVQFASGETYLTLKDYTGGIAILAEAKENLQKTLSINPEDKNAARALAFSIINTGTHYSKLSEKSNRNEYLQKALKNKREGVEMLYKLKNEGNLNEYDNQYITEAENEINEIKTKLEK